MNAAAAPTDALRLLAGLIAADIRGGGPLLAVPLPVSDPRVRGRGRPRSVPFAITLAPLAIAA